MITTGIYLSHTGVAVFRAIRFEGANAHTAFKKSLTGYRVAATERILLQAKARGR